MAGIAKMGSCSYRRNHRLYVSRLKQSVARPHLSEELGEMIAIDCVVMERKKLGKHIRGELEQLGWSKDEQGSSALSLIRIRFRSYSFAHRSLSLSSFYIRVI